MRLRVCLTLFLLVPLFLIFSSVASAGYVVKQVRYRGMKELTFRYGPLTVYPGQANIQLDPLELQPRDPGFITRFTPDLVKASTGHPMPVDEVHIHHSTWLTGDASRAQFAGGEEKSIIQYPRGFGAPVSGQEKWFLSYMLHNYTALPQRVYLTWKMDFVPEASPAASSLTPLDTKWMNVSDGVYFPIFHAPRNSGRGGRYTFPDQARGEDRRYIGEDRRWVVDRDLTLIQTMGHMHPGALYTTLYVTRDGETKRLFRSRAKYFGVSTPISFDMSIAGSSPDWRVKLKRGDVLSVNVTTDTSRTSWFESMGVMPVAFAEGHKNGGVDPFSPGARIPQRGVLSHGSLPENRNQGGLPASLPDPRSLPDGPTLDDRYKIPIQGFRYGSGDLTNPGPTSHPPVVNRGESLSFINLDATRETEEDRSAYHTITACKAPCNATTGVTYPLADGKTSFDSGQLGFGPFGQTPAANRNTWSTPPGLSPGTYTFFCRIHPFMRGAFRVSDNSRSDIGSTWSSLPRQRGAL